MSFDGKVVFLAVNSCYADGLLAFGNNCLAYFLYDIVYKTKTTLASTGDLAIGSVVHFTAQIVNAKLKLYWAIQVWIKTKPTVKTAKNIMYSTDRVMEIYCGYKTKLNASVKELETYSMLIRKSNLTRWQISATSFGQASSSSQTPVPSKSQSAPSNAQNPNPLVATLTTGGVIVFLKFSYFYADGFISSRKKLIYFLCENVYKSESNPVTMESTLEDLAIGLDIKFTASVVNKKLQFFVAHRLWLQEEPKHVVTGKVMYSVDRVLDMYRMYHLDLNTADKIIEASSTKLRDSFVSFVDSSQIPAVSSPQIQSPNVLASFNPKLDTCAHILDFSAVPTFSACGHIVHLNLSYFFAEGLILLENKSTLVYFLCESVYKTENTRVTVTSAIKDLAINLRVKAEITLVHPELDLTLAHYVWLKSKPKCTELKRIPCSIDRIIDLYRKYQTMVNTSSAIIQESSTMIRDSLLKRLQATDGPGETSCNADSLHSYDNRQTCIKLQNVPASSAKTQTSTVPTNTASNVKTQTFSVAEKVTASSVKPRDSSIDLNFTTTILKTHTAYGALDCTICKAKAETTTSNSQTKPSSSSQSCVTSSSETEASSSAYNLTSNTGNSDFSSSLITNATGKIVFLKVGFFLADGFIFSQKKRMLTYFLCENVYKTKTERVPLRAAMNDLAIGLEVNFTASHISEKLNFFVAHQVWLKNKPTVNDLMEKTIYSVDRVLDIYSLYKTDLNIVNKEILSSSCLRDALWARFKAQISISNDKISAPLTGQIIHSSGHIVFLDISYSFSDGFVSFKSHGKLGLVYFLFENAFNTNEKKMRTVDISVGLIVSFTAYLINKEINFYVARSIGKDSQPSAKLTRIIYSIDRVMVLYRSYKIYLRIASAEIELSSKLIEDSLVARFPAPRASSSSLKLDPVKNSFGRSLEGSSKSQVNAGSSAHLQSKIVPNIPRKPTECDKNFGPLAGFRGFVCTEINNNEGLLLWYSPHVRSVTIVWFNRTHLNAQKKMWSMKDLIGSSFYFDAVPIGKVSKRLHFYEATALWEEVPLNPAAHEENICIPLSEYQSESEFTALLREGKQMTHRGEDVKVIQKFHLKIWKHKFVKKIREMRKSMGGSTTGDMVAHIDTYQEKATQDSEQHKRQHFVSNGGLRDNTSKDPFNLYKFMTNFKEESSTFTVEDVEDKIVREYSEQAVLDFLRSLYFQKKGHKSTADRSSQTTTTGAVLYTNVYTEA